MGNTHAVGRRGRVLRHANDRAQRRFHAACVDWRILIEDDPLTRLYVEAERLVDNIMAEPHALPVVTLEEILGTMSVEARRGLGLFASYDSRLDEYQTRGA